LRSECSNSSLTEVETSTLILLPLARLYVIVMNGFYIIFSSRSSCLRIASRTAADERRGRGTATGIVPCRPGTDFGPMWPEVEKRLVP